MTLYTVSRKPENSNSATTLLTVRDLAVGYDSHAVLRGVNFTVDAGDYLCIVGENGSGKSTLMKTLLGLQPPLAGEIRRSFDAHEIGYLPQLAEAQKDFPAAVGEIVLSGFQGRTGRRPFYSREEKREAERNMNRMGILPLKHRSFQALSGGQKQRVLLARALCAADRRLLLDEPVTGLDPEAAEDMYRLVRALHQDGMTILMITHDLRAAVRDAEHILKVGEEPWFGKRNEFIEQELSGTRDELEDKTGTGQRTIPDETPVQNQESISEEASVQNQETIPEGEHMHD